ncbi:TNF receptor-associated factor 4 [Exaiptasia diaphana]|uniref:Uncharacterized protein n=1 Tax=Exaiptasia diaphana TaxID=2652724 RepID=A0A913WVZ7_EXADI|nr:TNF receptor-associated factor 4 [Exaiptasia diaphana]KXJ17485.1 TNF receptor-associated factor 4 [Exaiptasia diaphana]
MVDRSVEYPYETVNPLPRDYECPICQMLLCEPQQIVKCGHRYCMKCLEPVLRQEQPLCPLDRQEIVVDEVFTDQACKRAILVLEVKCLNSSKGCPWTGELSNAQNHRDKCPLERISCSNYNCDKVVERKDELKHSQEECIWRNIQCEHCTEYYSLCLKEDHIMTCPLFPMSCTNQCNTKAIPRREMNEHIKNCCPLAVVECPYTDIGCNIKMKRSELQKHLELSVQSHLDFTYQRLKVEELQQRELNCEMQKKWEEVEELKERIFELERQPTKYDGRFLWRINKYDQRLSDARQGKERYLYSDPFFSGRYGYKFRVCVGFNGDGDAKGTHVSVYINLVRGKFDALLPWPYSTKIVFTLMDQRHDENERKNIVMDIIPDTTLEGWQRPKTDQNPGVGIWKFAKHENIKNKGFLKDDEIFLKVEVEPFDLLRKD